MGTKSGGPLAGVRVLALAGMGPLPFASMLFADLGASVVRVVRPSTRVGKVVEQTSALRPEHDLVNRGVRSVCVDLKDTVGVAQLVELARRADVFMEGFRPGVAERLGVGPDVLLAANPALVYARFTGYGQGGPLAKRAGHDINYVAQTGALYALAGDGETPRPPLNLLGDYAGGAAIGALGVLAALWESRQSGDGQVVDAAMIDGVALLTTKIQGLRASQVFRDVPGTNWIDGGAPFYGVFRCADGRHVAVGALESDFYEAFRSGLGPDTADWPDPADQTQWPRLRELVAARLGERPVADWVRRFAGTDACVTPVLTFDEAASDPHNAERGLYREVAGALHPTPAPRLSRTAAAAPIAPQTNLTDAETVLAEWR
jgi:alpha-methylacyl-CoA racemase